MKVKECILQSGELVLRKVMSDTKDPTSGVLGPTWEGPYKVTIVVRQSTYGLENQHDKVVSHPWNAEHLKICYH